jgi:hypothetical protein
VTLLARASGQSIPIEFSWIAARRAEELLGIFGKPD